MTKSTLNAAISRTVCTSYSSLAGARPDLATAHLSSHTPAPIVHTTNPPPLSSHGHEASHHEPAPALEGVSNGRGLEHERAPHSELGVLADVVNINLMDSLPHKSSPLASNSAWWDAPYGLSLPSPDASLSNLSGTTVNLDAPTPSPLRVTSSVELSARLPTVLSPFQATAAATTRSSPRSSPLPQTPRVHRHYDATQALTPHRHARHYSPLPYTPRPRRVEQLAQSLPALDLHALPVVRHPGSPHSPAKAALLASEVQPPRIDHPGVPLPHRHGEGPRTVPPRPSSPTVEGRRQTKKTLRADGKDP